MPIEAASEISVLDQREFHALDERFMGIVFSVHNEFGRLLDESLHANAIAGRCVVAGLEPAEREVRLRVSHGTFRKDYVMDLLIAHGLMVETKTVETLTSAHRAQALHYLLLAGLKHGRLLNLRTDRVQHEYVSTTLDPQERRQFVIDDADWREANPASRLLKQKFTELLKDWGAFLEVGLYRQGVMHFLGGASAAPQEVEVFDGTRVLGRQQVWMLNQDTAFACTALTHGIPEMRQHQRRFLDHTRLRFMQWINLNHHQIEFRTLAK